MFDLYLETTNQGKMLEICKLLLTIRFGILFPFPCPLEELEPFRLAKLRQNGCKTYLSWCQLYLIHSVLLTSDDFLCYNNQFSHLYIPRILKVSLQCVLFQDKESRILTHSFVCVCVCECMYLHRSSSTSISDRNVINTNYWQNKLKSISVYIHLKLFTKNKVFQIFFFLEKRDFYPKNVFRSPKSMGNEQFCKYIILQI